jgi:predicted dehydrogenase
MLGAAVWGAGWVSKEHLKAYMANPHTEVVAVGSRSKEGALAKTRELGLTCEVYDDLSEMLKRSDLGVVSICTPNDRHVSDLMQCARAGKHALIEKPLALNMADYALAREAVRQSGIKTLVGFELHWNPYVELLRNLVNDGTLGDIVFMEAGYFSEQGPWWPGFTWGITRKQGGTVIAAAGCHAVDLLCSFGGEVDEVFAYQGRRNRQDYEYEPTISGVIRFRNGIIASLSASFEVHAPYVFPLVIGGSKGCVRDGKLHADRFAGQTDWIVLPSVYPDTPQVTHHPFPEEVDHFVDCILTGKESFLSVENIATSVQTGLALDLSAQTGKPVRLPLD